MRFSHEDWISLKGEGQVEQHWVEQHWVEHALGAGVVEPIEDPNTGQLFEPLKKRK